jgi:hypothetical protein
MAILARRNWSLLLTEATRRLKGIDYTGFDVRVQHWLWQSYLWLCCNYGHFELDKTITGTLSTSTNQIDLTSVATDLWIVYGLELKSTASGNPPLQLVKQREVHEHFARYRAETSRPEWFTRFGTKLYLDKIPDAAYPYELYYRRLPTSPDFVTPTSPDVTVDCDEVILAGAVWLGAGHLSMADLMASEPSLVDLWRGTQVRPLLAGGGTVDRPRTPKVNQTHQGEQG